MLKNFKIQKINNRNINNIFYFNVKKFLISFLFCVSFIPFAYAEVPITTGFIPGQIWYSKEPLVEGDTVKVYTAIWNEDSDPLSAKVTFYDKNVILGTRDIVVPSSEVKDVSVSWQVTSGDHVISAKIVSSSLKSEKVTLTRSSTAEDRKTVSVTLKTSDGSTATNSDIINSQIDNVSSMVTGVLPSSVSTPISKGVDTLDTFRNTTSAKIDSAKKDTQKQIDAFSIKDTSVKKTDKAKTLSDENIKNTQALSQIEKPIAYVKLFFLTVFSFIFNSKVIFYGLIALLVFVLIRYLYRKIRNR